MIYILKDSSGNVISFGPTPYTPTDGQTQETVEGTPADYEGRFKLVADKTTITADDTDEATVTVYCNTGAASVDVDVAGTTVTVTLTDGSGQLPGITSAVAGAIPIRPADETQFSRAGMGSLAIQAVEA